MITDDDRKLLMYRKSSRKLKDNYPGKKKHNASLTLYPETNTKSFENFSSIINQIVFESELEKLQKLSADHQYKYLKYTLKSMN